jgi:hypothetical protein
VKRAENQVKFDIDSIDEYFGFFRLELAVPIASA